jgi:hypothetical protein
MGSLASVIELLPRMRIREPAPVSFAGQHLDTRRLGDEERSPCWSSAPSERVSTP